MSCYLHHCFIFNVSFQYTWYIHKTETTQMVLHISAAYRASYRTRCSKSSDKMLLILSTEMGFCITPFIPTLIQFSFVTLSVFPVSATISGFSWRFANFSRIVTASSKPSIPGMHTSKNTTWCSWETPCKHSSLELTVDTSHPKCSSSPFVTILLTLYNTNKIQHSVMWLKLLTVVPLNMKWNIEMIVIITKYKHILN